MKSVLLRIGCLLSVTILPLVGQLTRVANTTLNLPDSLPPATGYATENAFGKETFTNPICLASPSGENNRLFVVERDGRIMLLTDLNGKPTKQATPFLQLSAIPGLVSSTSRLTSEGECGLLSMAFHPNYATNGFFYIFYSFEVFTGSNWYRFERVARCKVSSTNPNVADPGSHTPLITQFDEASNHNGGDLAFGNDGYLYISVGDEGGGGDNYNNARFINRDFFGAILRIDVDQQTGSIAPNAHSQTVPGTNPYPSAVNPGTYKIPADNPFIGRTSWHNLPIAAASVRTEIYATGLRNPFRFSVDRVTGRVFVGDVGQGAREEIDLITSGGDYGWSWREGNIAYDNPPAPTSPPTTGFNPIAPITDYPRSDGYSVTGGQVMRGSRLPELTGKYIFSDYGSGKLWSLTENAGTWNRAQLITYPGIVEFGTDPRNNDTIFCTLGSSSIQRLVRSYTGTAPPSLLSGTGAFSNLTTLTPNSGVVPYDVNVPFWSDYALKQRWFAIKNTTDTVGFSPAGNWTLPKGMVWVKHFDLETKRGDLTTKRKLETRFIVKTSTDVYGLTYRWRADQSDADLVEEDGLSEPLSIEVNGQPTTQVWRYPSRGECRSCHTAQGGFALSFNTHQLNRAHLYGSQNLNQLTALSNAGYFSQAIGNVATLPSFAPAADTTQSLEWRVRSYLAVNCVSCHQPGGSGLGNWDARITTSTDSANIIRGLLNDTGNSTSNRFVVPGDITHSMLVQRLEGISAPRMPPIASNQIDPAAIKLVKDWITQSLPARQTFAEWQVANFPDPTAPATAASSDFDGDGANNELEFLARTDPKSPSSVQGLSAPTFSNGNVTFSFLQPAERSAQVETSSNLQTWTLLDAVENIPNYSATSEMRTLTTAELNSPQFYRLRLSQP